jgi:hypothetical protein
LREKLQVQHQIEELHGVIQRQQPVVVKVGRRLLDLNRSFGECGHLNVAGKLYLLFLDTDIDVVRCEKAAEARRIDGCRSAAASRPSSLSQCPMRCNSSY